MTNLAVEAAKLGKRFRIYSWPPDRLLGTGNARMKEHWALRGVDLALPPGRCLGIIGVNGAGKSTLLKLLTGVILPTEGSLALVAKPLALLELGTGFNSELTGRENLFATGALLGYSAEPILSKLAAIRDFADIGDYFDQPTKTYSSGMFMRLAFSLYINLDCEVLIVDEALSVGDFFFQQKCAAALRAIKQRGTSILFVSHDTAAVQEMADEAILLKEGRIVVSGDPNTVVTQYFAMSGDSVARSKKFPGTDASELTEGSSNPDGALRNLIDEICADDIISGKLGIGDGGARFVALRVLDQEGQLSLTFPSGSRARFETVIEARREIPFANWGILISDGQDRTIWAAATSNQSLLLGRMLANDRVVISFEVGLDLQPGTYFVNLTTGEFDLNDPAYAIRNDVRLRAIELLIIGAETLSERTGLAHIPLEISAL